MSTYSSSGLVRHPSSRPRITRFIKLYLSIEPTDYWFHQTLTFKDNKTDEVEAKRYLAKLLDTLRKGYPQMPALFVQERQQRLGVHYHVLFFLFGPQPHTPEETRKQLQTEVFRRWSGINGGVLQQNANRMTLRSKNPVGLEYLLKGIQPTAGSTKREAMWFGVRQGQVLKAHAVPVSAKQVRDAFRDIFKFRTRETASPNITKTAPSPSKPSIAGLKAYLEWTGAAEDWPTFKRQSSGKAVSDSDFLDSLNPPNSTPKTADDGSTL